MSLLRLDPALSAVVERSRAEAAAAGQLIAPRCGPLRSPLSLDEQRVVRDWLDQGGYERALAMIVAEEPGIANQ